MSWGAIIEADRREMARALEGLAAELAGSTVLVTGARGMLPAYVLHAIAGLNAGALAADPCTVVALARRAPTGAWAELEHVRWVQQDVRAPLPEGLRFDWAIHAASKAAPRAYLADPVGTLMANGLGLHHVLERARACDARGALFMSSGEVYGSPPSEACPTPEGYLGVTDPRHPRGCYVEGKRFGEALAVAYGRQHGVPVKAVRPFQVFGPGLALDDGRAFADFLGAAARGESIVLRSAGRAMRSYCYIADATVAFLKVLVEGRAGEVYNVGSSSPEVTIRELAERVARLGGRGSEVVFAASPSEDGAGSPARTCPDVSKLDEELGWRPTTALEDGLRRTLAWLQEEERR
ncbi:MAG: UDP-glucuronate decarboxylase [Myxococcales bacterium]|nr:UDP-glucuronate decarboxylase [Myxococcales bacterium]